RLSQRSQGRSDGRSPAGRFPPAASQPAAGVASRRRRPPGAAPAFGGAASDRGFAYGAGTAAAAAPQGVFPVGPAGFGQAADPFPVVSRVAPEVPDVRQPAA